MSSSIAIATPEIAIARERFFDSRRGIPEDRRMVLGRGQHDRAASMSHQYRGARIAHVAVNTLDGDRTGRKRFQNLDNSLVDVTEPLAHAAAKRDLVARRLGTAEYLSTPRGAD